MPTRLLRDWTDSLRFDGISADAERLFVRLIMKADDYGRFHAKPQLVKSSCFPLAEDLRSNTVAVWLTELSDRQLVFRYTSGTGEYLAIPNFGQRLKQSRPKFPPPPGKEPDWMPNQGHFPEVPGSSRKFPSDSYSDTDTETNTETLNPPSPPRGCEKRARFVPPTESEVSLQCAKIGLPESEGVRFMAYYQSNGWRVGRNPMKSWPAALINWRGNWQEKTHGNRNNNGGTHAPGLSDNTAERLRALSVPGASDPWHDASGDDPPKNLGA